MPPTPFLVTMRNAVTAALGPIPPTGSRVHHRLGLRRRNADRVGDQIGPRVSGLERQQLDGSPIPLPPAPAAPAPARPRPRRCCPRRLIPSVGIAVPAGGEAEAGDDGHGGRQFEIEARLRHRVYSVKATRVMPGMPFCSSIWRMVAASMFPRRSTSSTSLPLSLPSAGSTADTSMTRVFGNSAAILGQTSGRVLGVEDHRGPLRIGSCWSRRR